MLLGFSFRTISSSPFGSPTIMHCTAKTVLSGLMPFGNACPYTLPTFLLPSLTGMNKSAPAPQQVSHFSSTPVQCKVTRRERMRRNPLLNMSALRRTGLNRHQKSLLEVDPKELPRPVERRTIIEIDENHGLWQFFPKSRTPMATPEELNSHGRAWTVYDLRRKDWDDLHRLWWVCIKEMNYLKTSAHERTRHGNMYGDFESKEREKTVRDQVDMQHWLDLAADPSTDCENHACDQTHFDRALVQMGECACHGHV